MAHTRNTDADKLRTLAVSRHLELVTCAMIAHAQADQLRCARDADLRRLAICVPPNVRQTFLDHAKQRVLNFGGQAIAPGAGFSKLDLHAAAFMKTFHIPLERGY